MIGTITRHGKDQRSCSNLCRHLLRAVENEEIVVVTYGTVAETLNGAIADMFAVGQSAGLESTLAHASLSPAQPMTDDQLIDAGWNLLRWFGANDGRPVAFVIHKKPRLDGAGERHLHIIFSRSGPSGTTRAGFEKIRLETFCRVLEHELGEPFTPGRHTQASIKYLQSNGHADVAAALEAATAGICKPRGAITSNRRQSLRRARVDDRKLRKSICDMWRTSTSADDFRQALADSKISLTSGRKPGILIIQYAEQTVGSLDRILRKPRASVFARLSTADAWPKPSAPAKSSNAPMEQQSVGARHASPSTRHQRAQSPATDAEFLAGEMPADYENHTDMWGIGIVQRPPRKPRF